MCFVLNRIFYLNLLLRSPNWDFLQGKQEIFEGNYYWMVTSHNSDTLLMMLTPNETFLFNLFTHSCAYKNFPNLFIFTL